MTDHAAAPTPQEPPTPAAKTVHIVYVGRDRTPNPDTPKGKVQTFRGWHKEASFWRDIYTRTLGGVGAATIVGLYLLVDGAIDPESFVIVLVVVVSVVGFGVAGVTAVDAKERGQIGRLAGALALVVAVALAAAVVVFGIVYVWR